MERVDRIVGAIFVVMGVLGLLISVYIVTTPL